MPKKKTHKGAIKRGYKPPKKNSKNKTPYIEKRIREAMLEEKKNNNGDEE